MDAAVNQKQIIIFRALQARTFLGKVIPKGVVPLGIRQKAINTLHDFAGLVIAIESHEGNIAISLVF